MPALIIDENNYQAQITERLDRLDLTAGEPLAGCLPRRSEYGCCRHVAKATDFITPIPREEWADLIKAGQGTFLHDLCKDKLPCHDQGGTNYCWAHGPTRAAEVLPVADGQDPVILSAESVAVPITGGRNRGGYPEDALHQLRNHGACEQSYWPLNDRDESNAKAGWEENRKLYRLIRWVDLNSFDMQMTLALLRYPVPIGLSWWTHCVCQLDPIHFGGKDFGIGIDNSHGADWGDNGYGILTERRGTADIGAFAPITENFREKLAALKKDLGIK